MLTAAAVLYFGYVNNHNCYIIISIVIRLVTRYSINTRYRTYWRDSRDALFVPGGEQLVLKITTLNSMLELVLLYE